MPQMKIIKVSTYIVPSEVHVNPKWYEGKTFLFVKLETDAGIDGWGEAYVLGDRERSTQTLIQEMERYLLGYNPLRIKNFQHWAYNFYAEQRPGIGLSCAISAIEIAMWDIMGKYFKTPIYNLLGGPIFKKLRVYANLASSSFKTPSEIANYALDMVKQGFTAVKMYPFDYSTDDDEAFNV